MRDLHIGSPVTTSISLPSVRAMPPCQAVLVSAAIVVLWALWAAYFNTAQFGDNVE